MNFRRNLISSASAVLLSLALIPAASAQTVLKASDVHPAGYPNVVEVENMGKKLEAATGGRYKLKCSLAVCWALKKKLLSKPKSARSKLLVFPWASWAQWCPM